MLFPLDKLVSFIFFSVPVLMIAVSLLPAQSPLPAVMDLHDDQSQVLEDLAVRIPVLRNDRSGTYPLDTGSLTVSRENAPVYGTVSINQHSGYITYTPIQDYFGMDTFIYTICDVFGICTSALVSIQVHSVDDLPVIKNDFVHLYEDQDTLFDVLANDTDTMDHELMDFHSLRIISPPGQGNASISNGKLYYKPRSNYFGGDLVRYAVCEEPSEGTTWCDSATVYIQVLPVNDPPVVENDTVTTFPGIPIVIDVLANDHDSIDGIFAWDPALLQIDLDASHGHVFVDQEVGMIIYTPKPAYTGTDRFLYSICDQDTVEALCTQGQVLVIVEEPEQSVVRSNPRESQEISLKDLEENATEKDYLPLQSSLQKVEQDLPKS